MGVFLIAECGVNWRDLKEAKRLIEVFKEVGADACKFQMYRPHQVASHPRAKELQDIIVDEERARELKEHGESIDMEVFFTPMYLEAVDVLEKLGVNRYKIRSRDALNTSLLQKVLATGKDVMISVANDRVDWEPLMQPGPDGKELRYRVKLLHCIEHYPAPDDEVHLCAAFPALRSYRSSVEYAGVSDHTVGITCAVAAVAMGAVIVEKHVKLDNSFDWIDNRVAVTPLEFKEMVEHIRRVEVLRR